MAILCMYIIVAFGMFLSALFEREKIIWCFVAGIFWPVVLWRIIAIRYYGNN